MLKVIRRGGPANAKQSQGVQEGNRLEKLKTWEDRREPSFALGGQQRAFRRRHSSTILWLLQGLSVSDCHTHEGLALCSELCLEPSFPGRKSHYLMPTVPESFQCLSPRTSGMLLVLWTQQRENTCVTLLLSFALWKCSSSSVCLCDSIFTLTFRISWSPFTSLVQKMCRLHVLFP